MAAGVETDRLEESEELFHFQFQCQDRDKCDKDRLRAWFRHSARGRSGGRGRLLRYGLASSPLALLKAI